MFIKFFNWLKGKKSNHISKSSDVTPYYAMNIESDHIGKKRDMSDYSDTDFMISSINFDHSFYRSEDIHHNNIDYDAPSDSTYDCSNDFSSDCGGCD